LLFAKNALYKPLRSAISNSEFSSSKDNLFLVTMSSSSPTGNQPPTNNAAAAATPSTEISNGSKDVSVMTTSELHAEGRLQSPEILRIFRELKQATVESDRNVFRRGIQSLVDGSTRRLALYRELSRREMTDYSASIASCNTSNFRFGVWLSLINDSEEKAADVMRAAREVLDKLIEELVESMQESRQS